MVLIGLTVSSASFVRALEASLPSSDDIDIDGIVAVAHNEGFLEWASMGGFSSGLGCGFILE